MRDAQNLCVKNFKMINERPDPMRGKGWTPFAMVTDLLEEIRPERRTTFKAYDGLNNLFNLGYELLSWKVHKALISAKLEPYLGFLHSEQVGKPSLVCDFMEIYRFMIDDFLIQYCRKLKTKDFIMKYEALSRHKIGKREYLNDLDTKELMNSINKYFETMIEIPRIKHGKRQTFETLINEEALLLASYFRNERQDWNPRIPQILKEKTEASDFAG
jgi:CRISPR-associated endonuclease Cas1